MIAQEACRINGISLNALGASRRETLLREAERAKRELTDRDSHAFLRSSIPALPQVLHLTNKGLFELAVPLFTRIERPLKQAVYDSDVPAEEISRAVLVGGSSRMPVVRDYLKRLLAVPVTCEEDCDVAVALGLGTYVGIKQRARGVDSLVLTDICPHSLSTDVRNPHPPFEPLQHHAAGEQLAGVRQFAGGCARGSRGGIPGREHVRAGQQAAGGAHGAAAA